MLRLSVDLRKLTFTSAAPPVSYQLFSPKEEQMSLAANVGAAYLPSHREAYRSHNTQQMQRSPILGRDCHCAFEMVQTTSSLYLKDQSIIWLDEMFVRSLKQARYNSMARFRWRDCHVWETPEKLQVLNDVETLGGIDLEHIKYSAVMMLPDNQASIVRWLWLKKLLIITFMLAETAQMTFPKFVVQPGKSAPLSLDNINPGVIEAQFAVHGEIPQRAEELSADLLRSSNPMKEFGFTYILRNNIGNPQEVGQEPITFARQVAVLAEYPELSRDVKFPSDVVRRAEELVKANGGSIGAYSSPQGIFLIRQHVAEFLEERDGIPADPESVYLTAGAAVGIKTMIQLLIASKEDGIMIPVPHYPLYSATLSLQKAREVDYRLSEEKGWEPALESVEKSIQDAAAAGTRTRAMIVTSPGNPVGNVLSLEAMHNIISFCASHNLVLMADEVYQSNIAKPIVKNFISFKRALSNHPDEKVRTQVPLVSFHSISKGQMGECGRRGGFFEIVNFPQDVQKQIAKLVAIDDAPVQGQIGVDVLVRPPKPGEPSYDLWYQQTTAIQQKMNENAQKLVESFKRLPSISSTEAEGAMYLYPKVELPRRAVEAAQKAGKEPDTFYCLQLLEKAGICVVPGSGFRQADNTFHFRTTFLGEHTDEFVRRFTKFHKDFLAEYQD